MIDKNRLLAISDGVIAIAVTIMALQLNIPEKVSLDAISQQYPILIAYLISFTQIFLAWHEHHDSMVFAEIINHRVFLANCVWLFFITLLPFATGVVGNSPNHTPTVLLYITVLLLVQLLITIISKMVEKLNGTAILDAPVISKIRVLSFVGYGLSAVCALFLPHIALFIIVIASTIEIVMMCLYDRSIADKVSQIAKKQADRT